VKTICRLKNDLNRSESNSEFRLSALGFFLFLVLIAGQAVYANEGNSQTLILVSGHSTQTAGFTEVEPSNPLDAASYNSGGWSPAVADSDFSMGYWYPNAQDPFGSGAIWVSSQAQTEGGYEDQWRLFAVNFDLPEGSTPVSANLWYTADNAVAVYLNDNEIGSAGTVYGPSSDTTHVYQDSHSVSFTPKKGSNTLKFVVRNWNLTGYNPTGLLYRAKIEYDVMTPTPTSMPSPTPTPTTKLTITETPATTVTITNPETATIIPVTTESLTVTPTETPGPTTEVTTTLVTTTSVKNIEKILEEQNKKIDEQNKLIAEQNKKIAEQSDLLSQLLSYLKGIFRRN
jgi:hypothetical protein